MRQCYADPVLHRNGGEGMGNLTLSIDDGVLRRARIHALEHGTSVNAMVRDYLCRLAGEDPAERAIAEFLDFARSRPPADEPTGGRTWTRGELYER